MKDEDVKLNMKVTLLHKSEDTSTSCLYVIGRGFDVKNNCDNWLLHESPREIWKGEFYHASDFEPYKEGEII